MAKYLDDKLKASEIKHCNTCSCANRDLTVLVETDKTFSVCTQTILQGEVNNALCLRCNSNLNSPSRTNSPYIMKLVKSSDSVISETKSSVSEIESHEKLFNPVKKDELTINPMLGHHRLCDRSSVGASKLLDLTSNSASSMNCSSDLYGKNRSPSSAAARDIGNGGCTRKTFDSAVNDSKSATLNSNAVVTESSNNLSSKNSNGNVNNAEGARMFESFNRNLIKSIKVSIRVIF